MRTFILVCLVLSPMLACDVQAPLAEFSAAVIWSGRPQSENIIDIRNGVACAPTGTSTPNCVAGWVDSACDPASCTRTYNTGNCHADTTTDPPSPLSSCQLQEVACDAGACGGAGSGS